MSSSEAFEAPSIGPIPSSLLEQLATVPDPRIERTKHHQLVDILAITLLAVLCGADNFTEIAQYGQAKKEWLETFLALPKGIPSHDTFSRVFARLDRHAVSACLTQWAQHVALMAGGLSPGEVVAIDGKTARRSGDVSGDSSGESSAGAAGGRAAGIKALHMVSAWATRHQLVLGQVKTADHSNEITAIPELLRLLDLKGTTVTIDAIGCQQAIARSIRDKKADYVLSFKTNQPWLHERVDQFRAATEAEPERYWRGVAHETTTTIEKDHGRIEKRRYTVVPAQAVIRNKEKRSAWADLRTVGWVESERELLSGPKAGKTERELRYFISSLPAKVGPLAHAVRSHWGIENQCHWTLDMVFQEDQSRTRKDHGPANLATIRRWVLSILRQDATHKHGLKARRLNAAWDNDYLLKLLGFAAAPATSI